MNTRVTKISRIIETLPEGGPPQGRYLNCVIEIQTALPPYELLRRLQKIEVDLGRVRTIKNGPRIIDLDILLYGDVQINPVPSTEKRRIRVRRGGVKENSLCIPHPRMLKREFVMRPLKEIAPGVAKRLTPSLRTGAGLKGKKAIRKQKRRKNKR